MRANTQRTYNNGEQETRGWEREGKNSVEQRDLRRSLDGRAMGQGTQGKQDGHCCAVTFRKESRGFEGGGFGVD